MKAERLDKLICDWSLRTGHGFRAKDLDSLVDLLADETEAELEELRRELTPVNDTWEDG